MAFLTGILLGLSTLVFIGPVLFYLLKSSMESGVRAGLSVALGIIVGDIICVILALFGVGRFFESEESQRWLAIVGGLILLLIGVKYLLKPAVNKEVKEKFKHKSLGIYFLNGFLVNFVNPFVFFVWLGFLSINRAKYDQTDVIFSLTTTLLVIFTTDCLKAFFAGKLMRIIRPEIRSKVFRFFGVIMLVFAIRLLVFAFV